MLCSLQPDIPENLNKFVRNNRFLRLDSESAPLTQDSFFESPTGESVNSHNRVEWLQHLRY